MHAGCASPVMREPVQLDWDVVLARLINCCSGTVYVFVAVVVYCCSVPVFSLVCEASRARPAISVCSSRQ